MVHSHLHTRFCCTKNTKHVHVLGLEGHMHDTNTSPKTNCATAIEDNFLIFIKATVESGPSYPMGPLGPGPGPPSLRGPQTAHALFFHLVK